MSVTEPETKQLATPDVSTTVVMAIAEATDTPPEKLPPLFDVIDPDALNAIFRPRVDGHPQTEVRVSFTMAGCTVSIQGDAVTVTPDAKATADRPLSESAKQ